MDLSQSLRCSIPDCDAPVLCRGWCNKHYQRWYRCGDAAYEAVVQRPSLEYGCQQCGERFMGKQSRTKDGRNKFCSKACHNAAMREAGTIAGPNNPNWKGGATTLHKQRPHPYTQQAIRRPIYERDGWACRVCGMTNDESHERFGRDLTIHHIKRYVVDPDDSPENCLTVCSVCHPKLHWVTEHAVA